MLNKTAHTLSRTTSVDAIVITETAGKKKQYAVRGGGVEHGPFDAVVIATPLEFAALKILRQPSSDMQGSSPSSAPASSADAEQKAPQASVCLTSQICLSYVLMSLQLGNSSASFKRPCTT